ncbi:MAG TPA: rhodanese-like domain-containing protein [Bacteroidota bacterium]|nr:rhodanese-like domain-containing protein [Bacteroidota bacterium]
MITLQNPSVPTIDVREAFQQMQKRDVLMLDVRTLAEWNGELGHVENAVLIPVQELAARLDELEKYKGKTILAICRSGNRSGRAAALLNQRGFKAFNVAGGMIKWNAEKLPVVREDNQ